MKRFIIYWVLFAAVLIFSGYVFYSYWKATGENPLTSLYKNPAEGKLSQDDLSVSKDGELPSVSVWGSLVDYQFVENRETKKNELFVKLLIGEEILPVRIDSFSVSAKSPGLLAVIETIDPDQKDYMLEILEESRAKSPLILDNNIRLTSINTSEQRKLCVNNMNEFVSGLGEKWCKFNLGEKSYSKEELLKLLKSALGKSKYLTLTGNVFVSLQVNFNSENF